CDGFGRIGREPPYLHPGADDLVVVLFFQELDDGIVPLDVGEAVPPAFTKGLLATHPHGHDVALEMVPLVTFEVEAPDIIDADDFTDSFESQLLAALQYSVERIAILERQPFAVERVLLVH